MTYRKIDLTYKWRQKTQIDAVLVNFRMTFYALTQLKTHNWRRHFIFPQSIANGYPGAFIVSPFTKYKDFHSHALRTSPFQKFLAAPMFTKIYFCLAYIGCQIKFTRPHPRQKNIRCMKLSSIIICSSWPIFFCVIIIIVCVCCRVTSLQIRL